MKRAYSASRPQRRGGVMLLICILLPVLLILVAFAINLAWIDLSRTQSFIAADAAARAAGRTYALTGSVDQAKAKAREIAKLNAVAGREIQLSDSDFTLGESTRNGSAGRYKFSPGGDSPNALKVSIKRNNSSSNGSIPLLFKNFLSTKEFDFEKSTVSTRVDVDVAFVVDRSGSMIYAHNEKATGDPPKANPKWQVGDPVPVPSRWIDLAFSTNALLKQMESSVIEERIALVTYSTDSKVDQSLTGKYSNILDRINGYSKKFPGGKTNIGNGLKDALNALGGSGSRASASKVVILMTDGRLNAPSGAPDPVKVAKEAADNGVVIFTITFSDEADKSLMKKVAAAGSGVHFHADSGKSLAQVLETIARMLPTVLTE